MTRKKILVNMYGIKENKKTSIIAKKKNGISTHIYFPQLNHRVVQKSIYGFWFNCIVMEIITLLATWFYYWVLK